MRGRVKGHVSPELVRLTGDFLCDTLTEPQVTREILRILGRGSHRHFGLEGVVMKNVSLTFDGGATLK